MYRTTGLGILAVGAIVTFLTVFTGFNHSVKSWEVDRNTGDVSQVAIACPAPVGIVFGDAETEADPAWGQNLCVRTGQRLFFSGVAVAIVALGLGSWAVSRGPRPVTKSIDTLPSFGADSGRD